MTCQKCELKEASVHIAVLPQEGASRGSTEFTLHFCPECHEQYERERLAEAFPSEQPVQEQLRVIESTPKFTVVRLVRTESQPSPQEWRLVTSRLPKQYRSVGMEFGIAFTSAQLDYLKGNRDSI
jgi:hypothetical protein